MGIRQASETGDEVATGQVAQQSDKVHGISMRCSYQGKVYRLVAYSDARCCNCHPFHVLPSPLAQVAAMAAWQ